MSYSARKFSVGGGDDAWVVEFTGGFTSSDVIPKMVDADDNSYWLFQGGSIIKMTPDGNVDTAIDWNTPFVSLSSGINTIGGYVSNNQSYFAHVEGGTPGAGTGFDSSLTATVQGGECFALTSILTEVYQMANGDNWQSAPISASTTSTWYRYIAGNTNPQDRQYRVFNPASVEWRHTNEASNGDWLFSGSNDAPNGDRGYISRNTKTAGVTAVWGRQLTSDVPEGAPNQPYSFARKIVEDPSDSTQIYICGGNNWAALNPGGDVDGFDVQAYLVRLTASTGVTEIGYQYTTTNQFVYFKAMVMDSNGDSYVLFNNSSSSITGVVKINTSLASNWTVEWERSFGTTSNINEIALSPDEEHFYLGSRVDCILKLPVDGEFIGTYGPVTITASTILTREALQLGNVINTAAIKLESDISRVAKTVGGSASTITPTTSKTGV